MVLESIYEFIDRIEVLSVVVVAVRRDWTLFAATKLPIKSIACSS